jgi:hypothetical protein
MAKSFNDDWWLHNRWVRRRSPELCSLRPGQDRLKPFDFEASEFGRCGPLLDCLVVGRAFRLHLPPSLFVFTGSPQCRLKRGILRFCGRGHRSEFYYLGLVQVNLRGRPLKLGQHAIQRVSIGDVSYLDFFSTLLCAFRLRRRNLSHIRGSTGKAAIRPVSAL